ncbi:MAG: efflux RND transporter periplasmic adaptor subunit [Dinoroseobacter sp.]|nr:efflux RND transporter periplasmic adaptor subunit [Dinoroseobacter sp.]
MRFLTRSLIGLALLSLTLGLLGYGVLVLQSALQDRAERDAAPRSQRERVYTAPVSRIVPQDIAPELVAYGELRSLRSVELRAPAAGWISETHPDLRDGRTIRAGEVVLRIDPAGAETALATAEADLAEAETVFADAERAYTLAQDELAAATAQAELRFQALTRQIDLRDRGFGSDAAVETAALAEAAIRQTVLAQRQAVADAETRIEQAQTDVARQTIDLEDARRQLAETIIRAPFDGAFTNVSAEVGTRVSQAEQLATLIDPSQLEASFRLASGQYLRLLTEDSDLSPAKVSISLDVQGADIVTNGALTGVAAQVAEGLTGRQLFATLENTRGFQPGDFVTVTVTEPVLREVVELPAAALTPDGAVMALTNDDRLEAVPVTLLRRQGDFVLVDAKPVADREVVTQLTPVLGAGIKVRPIRPIDETANATGASVTSATMVALDDARRAELVALVERSTRFGQTAKDRLLTRLRQDEVPAELITRIESRAGG